jgi:hypothetical protein
MKKIEIVRNIGLATIPICLAVFVLGWIVFDNVIGALVLPIIIFLLSLYSNIRKFYKDKERDKAGFIKHRFKATKAYILIAPNDYVAPSLCLETENGKYVLLNGQWLYDEAIYGEESKKYYDEDSDIFNCYNAPFSFPCTEFELWISKLDDDPFKILVMGDYIEPEEVNWKTPEKFYDNKYAIIEKDEVISDY